MSKIGAINISGLFGTIDLRWELSSGVNILSGSNGSGKSTVLRALALLLLEGKGTYGEGSVIREIAIEGEVSSVDVIVYNREENSKSSSFGGFERFADVVDSLFESSSKRVKREKWHEGMAISELAFELNHGGKSSEICYDWLSSGEKLAVSLFWAVSVRENAEVLLVDEPEISLSIEWQKTLLENILEINPDLQIIVATHSPALVMRGWVGRVTEIDDLYL